MLILQAMGVNGVSKGIGKLPYPLNQNGYTKGWKICLITPHHTSPAGQDLQSWSLDGGLLIPLRKPIKIPIKNLSFKQRSDQLN